MKDGTAYVTRTIGNGEVKNEFQINNSTLKIKGTAIFLINHFNNGKITLITLKHPNDVQEEKK